MQKKESNNESANQHRNKRTQAVNDWIVAVAKSLRFLPLLALIFEHLNCIDGAGKSKRIEQLIFKNQNLKHSNGSKVDLHFTFEL